MLKTMLVVCAMFHVLPPLLMLAARSIAAGRVAVHTSTTCNWTRLLHQLVPLMVDLARLLLPSDSSKPLPLPQLLACLREARQLTALQSQQGVQHRSAHTVRSASVHWSLPSLFASVQPDRVLRRS